MILSILLLACGILSVCHNFDQVSHLITLTLLSSFADMLPFVFLRGAPFLPFFPFLHGLFSPVRLLGEQKRTVSVRDSCLTTPIAAAMLLADP